MHYFASRYPNIYLVQQDTKETARPIVPHGTEYGSRSSEERAKGVREGTPLASKWKLRGSSQPSGKGRRGISLLRAGACVSRRRTVDAASVRSRRIRPPKVHGVRQRLSLSIRSTGHSPQRRRQVRGKCSQPRGRAPPFSRRVATLLSAWHGRQQRGAIPGSRTGILESAIDQPVAPSGISFETCRRLPGVEAVREGPRRDAGLPRCRTQRPLRRRNQNPNEAPGIFRNAVEHPGQGGRATPVAPLRQTSHDHGHPGI